MVVILHEGKDDKKYLKRILDFLNISYSDDTFYEMNNKSNFFKKDFIGYKILKQKIDNDEITKLLFLLDADYKSEQRTSGGSDNTISSLESTIKELSFTCEKEIFVVCEPSSDEGYFETLLLSCVSSELKECYSKFILCSGFTQKEQTKTIMTKLHELSRPDKPYSFEHDNFKPLKDTLIKLFS